MTLSADAENVTTKKELLLLFFFFLIGMLRPWLSDDEKDNVSYFPVPCIVYC